jgi:hypothetical protein
MTRVLVTGDRQWEARDVAQKVIDRLIAKYGGDEITIVHGAAQGVDVEFEITAKLAHVKCEAYPAMWYDLDVKGARIMKQANGTEYNAAAGPARNQKMVDTKPAYCIAVHKDLKNSKGTKNCVELCLKAGVPVYLIDSDDAEPRRIKSIGEA